MLALIAEIFPQPAITRNQVELMQIDSVASPGAPGFADLRISPTPLQDVLPAIADDAAIVFGVIYEASTAPCGSNAFHAPSKRKLAIAPVGNFPPADGSSLFKSAWASSSAKIPESRIVTDQKHRFRALRKVPELLPIVLVAPLHRSLFQDDPERLLRLGNGVVAFAVHAWP